ncbi:hypothetical protein BDZ45DRAFT_735069 [Acephala macrosclerotiorum]|nr:hypothetical protein BDZ45DRAFT_735069 [Acephala macrosclerotiorum]
MHPSYRECEIVGQDESQWEEWKYFVGPEKVLSRQNLNVPAAWGFPYPGVRFELRFIRRRGQIFQELDSPLALSKTPQTRLGLWIYTFLRAIGSSALDSGRLLCLTWAFPSNQTWLYSAFSLSISFILGAAQILLPNRFLFRFVFPCANKTSPVGSGIQSLVPRSNAMHEIELGLAIAPPSLQSVVSSWRILAFLDQELVRDFLIASLHIPSHRQLFNNGSPLPEATLKTKCRMFSALLSSQLVE